MIIKFADLCDLQTCVKLDLHGNIDFIKRKIEHNEIIVAKNGDDVIACLKFEFLWTHMPFISYIVVEETSKGQKVSKKLLDFLEAYLKNKNYKFLLSSTMPNSINSQNWHMHMKFIECGYIAGINDGIGEIFYRKNL
ncbi:MAG: GNAT family N-acetyltransferase [Sarcina sp.]